MCHQEMHNCMNSANLTSLKCPHKICGSKVNKQEQWYPPPLSFPTPGKTVPHHPLGDGHQLPHPPLGDRTPTVHAGRRGSTWQ